MTRILVHGDDRLAIAVADELARRDIELVRPGDAIGDPTHLDAAIFCADDDVANIDVALQLRERAPDLRLVLRSFNLSVQERLPELLGDCHVLSASQLAAAPFCDLAVGAGGPEHGPAGRSRWERAVDRISGSHGAAVARLLWRRPLLRWSLVAIVVLIAFEAVLAAAAFGYGPAQALHTGLAAIVTLGFNDAGLIGPALAGEAAWIQIGAVVTTLVDIVLVTVLLGVVADAFVSERFARVFGGSARRLRGHVVIAGLGTVGFRILRELVDSTRGSPRASRRSPPSPRRARLRVSWRRRSSMPRSWIDAIAPPHRGPSVWGSLRLIRQAHETQRTSSGCPHGFSHGGLHGAGAGHASSEPARRACVRAPHTTGASPWPQPPRSTPTRRWTWTPRASSSPTAAPSPPARSS